MNKPITRRCGQRNCKRKATYVLYDRKKTVGSDVCSECAKTITNACPDWILDPIAIGIKESE